MTDDSARTPGHGLLDLVLIMPDCTVREAVAVIDRGSIQIALVVDEAGKLLATVTDGDVRRGMLAGLSLEAPVSAVMNSRPLTILQGEGRAAALAKMRQHRYHQIPVVDAQGRVCGIEVLDSMLVPPRSDTFVVLMAGGLGMRLRPLTNEVPKPMLPVGGRPLLESIILNLAAQGYWRFFLSVNYKREVIESHFGDGSRFGVEISYLVENERLGTAGALQLLPELPQKPFVVMNGDVLSSVKLGRLLAFHEAQGAEATMAATTYDIQIPYGVLRTEGSRLVRIDEKPAQSFFVNAGIYVISPGALSVLQPGVPLNMPDLFNSLIGAGRTAAVFPLREYWMDVGHPEDLARARQDFDFEFGLPDGER